jgi:Divergent InlB B-repeat domain
MHLADHLPRPLPWRPHVRGDWAWRCRGCERPPRLDDRRALELASSNAPAAEQGWLTVVVEGGGTVAAPGITCPADCSEGYQLGSTVGLTASPSAGYELGGWSGACAGPGVCAATIGEATFVKAGFVPVARPSTARSPDLDRDGVQDLGDRCAQTARRLRLVMRGCSLPDLLQNGESLSDVYDFPGK